jgi:hypothetical protein
MRTAVKKEAAAGGGATSPSCPPCPPNQMSVLAARRPGGGVFANVVDYLPYKEESLGNFCGELSGVSRTT